MKIEEVEQLIRTGLSRHNLKLYPDFYLDLTNRTCCVIGAIMFSQMDALPKEDYVEPKMARSMIGYAESFELEAGFMKWRSISNGSAPEYFELGKKLRSECVLRKEEQQEEEENYELDDWGR